MNHTAEVIVIEGKQYVLIDRYIAIRVDALAEQYARRFSEWKKAEPDAQMPLPLTHTNQ